jgi:hypothetical protein
LINCVRTVAANLKEGAAEKLLSDPQSDKLPEDCDNNIAVAEGLLVKNAHVLNLFLLGLIAPSALAGPALS